MRVAHHAKQLRSTRGDAYESVDESDQPDERDELAEADSVEHLQQKLQDAAWAPDVERWESDEDSGGSDEEDDHAERLELAAEQILRLSQ